MDVSKMTDAELREAENERQRRSEVAHQEWRRVNYWEPRNKAEAELIARLQEQYGVDEDAQQDIASAWRDFYENWD